MKYNLDIITNIQSLKTFLACSERLKNVYMVDKVVLSNEWIKFNEDIGTSLESLYRFSLELLQEMGISYSDARFYSFYLDFIISKPSSSIFTETPKECHIDLFPEKAKKIALLAQNLYNMAKKDGSYVLRQDNFNKHFQEYFTNTFSYYDFIYDNKKGVFSKFSTNDELFFLQEENILSVINNLNTITNNDDKYKQLKRLLKDLVIQNIAISTDYYQDKKTSYDWINNKFNVSEIFDDYLAYQDKYSKDLKEIQTGSDKNHFLENANIIKFEIFSYVLANKLWKVSSIIQSAPEYKNKEEFHEDNKLFFDKTIDYIKKYLEKIKMFYKKEITLHNLYLEMHRLDYDYINNLIFKKFMFDITPYVSKKYNYSSDSKIYDDFWEKSKTIKAETMRRILKPMIRNEKDEKFKFYRLLAENNSTNISSVVDLLHNKIMDNEKENSAIDYDNIEYIGILRSGSFLSHALNILKIHKNYKNKNFNASSLLTHPYLTILPRTLSYRDAIKTKKFIYIDEAIKTGYSVAITDIYRKKILYLQTKKIIKSDDDYVVALSNFTNYSNKISSELDYQSIFDINIKENGNEKKLSFDIKDDYKINESFKWFAFLESLNIESIKKEIEDIAIEGSKIDLTKVISNSILLFKVAKYFAKILNKQIIDKEYKHLFFFSGSYEGKLLIDTLVFVYKTLYPKNIYDFYKENEDSKLKFYMDGKTSSLENLKEEHAVTIFIDTSIVTGSIMDRACNIDLKKNLKECFDLKYSIYGTNDIEREFYSIF